MPLTIPLKAPISLLNAESRVYFYSCTAMKEYMSCKKGVLCKLCILPFQCATGHPHEKKNQSSRKSSIPAACFPRGSLITSATVNLGPWQWLSGLGSPSAATPSRSRWTSKQPDNNFLMQVPGAGAKHVSFLTLPMVQRLMNRAWGFPR